jgi:hypothetical protein
MAKVEAKQEAQYGVLENVMVAYAKIAEPQDDKDKVDKEFAVTIITDDEDMVDTFSEQFPKVAVKKTKVADFEDKWKMPCPFKGVKSVWSFQLKRKATKDGKPWMENQAPKVFLEQNDGNRVEITKSRLIGNGSIGTVAYYISPGRTVKTKEGKDMAMPDHPYLSDLEFEEDNFKEYVSEFKEGGNGSDSGGGSPLRKKAVTVVEEEDEAVTKRREKLAAADGEKEAEEATAKAPAKPASKVVKPSKSADDEDDDSPF